MEVPLLALLVLCSSSLIGFSEAARQIAVVRRAAAAAAATTSSPNSYDIGKFGARGDGKTDDTKAFMDIWKAACAATGDIKILVPKATYLIGPIQFKGPCKSAKSIFFNMQGTLKASTDLNRYKSDSWLEFGWVDHVTLTGGGTIDGQGQASWKFNKCPKQKECKVLPINLKFVMCNHTVVRGLTSLNSKFFHVGLLSLNDFKATGLRISAPADSPNTDGIHIERSTDVMISQATIGTGDDCVSIGHGNERLTISGVTCGPGHGISVGSLGRYPYEKDVKHLVVRDSTITGTMFGVRIKTWENSPLLTQATNLTFQNIVMNNVANPIFIDQTYCPYASCSSQAPSKVKISDIHFKNIRGTSSTPVAVTLECSKGYPCEDVHLEDVHLDLAGGKKAVASCKNVRANYVGTQIPPPCA